MISVRPSRAMAMFAVALLALPGLIGCSSDEKAEAVAKSPEEVMSAAAVKLSETSGLVLALSTDNLPAGVTGITKASGVATATPAFDGTITVVLSGQSVDVPVIAVDGKVHAQIPFTPGWNVVDPAEYGAPDPSKLIDTDTGFPALLTLTEDLKKGETVRGGADNTEVLTTYTGVVEGAAMKHIIPSSAGDSFTVEWQVTEDAELREAAMTGIFYPKSTEMTYTVSFANYGTEKDIAAP